MPPKHVNDRLEAYLDRRLSPEMARTVEAHLAACPDCARQLAQAQRLAAELGPTMHKALGQPLPPPALRYKVRRAVAQANTPRQPVIPWAIPARVFNAVGTLAVIALLALAAFVVLQERLPGGRIMPQIASLSPGLGGAGNTTGTPVPPTSTPTPAPAGRQTPAAATARPSLGDTLPGPVAPAAPAASSPPPTAEARGPQPDTQPSAPALPDGLIAFSMFNPAGHRQVYEIHLIRPDGTDHRLFPLDGVSEPALHRTETGHQLAFRAWGQPTAPRSLLTSNLNGDTPYLIGGFWEDAQPDWSPTENRLIFASQRESDRRWRLYTIWGDGLAEKELRREGKSPSFAPDGYHFVFEGCDETGNRCGLWLGNLDDSEYGSEVMLADAQARSPDWSPVAEQIAYMANPNDNWDLYLFNRETGNTRRLTHHPAIDGLPVWSPDGNWLAFLSDRDGDWGIWALHVDSGALRQIFRFDGGTFDPPNRPPFGERHWWDEQLSWSR